MDTQSLLHWIYVGCMAAGVLLFFAWSHDPRGVPRYEYLVAMFIPTWSGLAYLAMAFDAGKVVVDGQVTHYARYADWVVTTPLLLLVLSWTAMHTIRKDITLIAALMGTDVVMVASGLVADLSTDLVMRWTFYSVGCVALVIILGLIWGPLKRIADTQHPDLARVYRRVAGMLSVLWVGYPTVWLLGPSGLRVIDQTTDTLLFVALPVLSKVGFSIVDLHGLRNLEHVPSHDERVRRDGVPLAAGA